MKYCHRCLSEIKNQMIKEQNEEILSNHPDYWKSNKALFDYEKAREFLIEEMKESISLSLLSGTIPPIIKAMIKYKDFCLTQDLEPKDEQLF